MLVTKEWYDAQITYDDEKYTHKTNEKGILYLIDKINGTIIFEGKYPSLIKQISEKEFIVNDRDNTSMRRYRFEHLLYNEEEKSIKVIFKLEYKGTSCLGTIYNLDDTYKIESYLETTLYNSTTKKVLTLKNTTVTLENDGDGNIELIAKRIIEKNFEKDVLTAIIDKDTLEFDGFYSRRQQKYIPLKQESSNFEQNYEQTIEQEVIRHLLLLSEQRQYYNQEIERQARLVLRKQNKERRNHTE